MVIGGAELYRQTLPLAQRIYLTEVQARVEDGDAWFTDFDRSAFRETQSESHGADERHAHPFRFVTLERVAASSSSSRPRRRYALARHAPQNWRGLHG